MTRPLGDDRQDSSIEPLGDGALLVRIGERIDASLNRRALAISNLLGNAKLAGVTDVSAAYASVCVHYDLGAWADPANVQSPYERIADSIAELIRSAKGESVSGSAQAGREGEGPGLAGLPEPLEIPVCYGADYGADLETVAEHAGIDPNEVIVRHTGGTYQVAMLGFMPGFAYLLGLDPMLHTPRRATPRTHVPAGSVAIGGAQTGIYPRELPGGWQLIGRTPLELFNPARAQPALLVPGQSVRFRAIDPDEFVRLSLS